MIDDRIDTAAPSVKRRARLEFITSAEVLLAAACVYFTLLCNTRFWAALLEDRSTRPAESLALVLTTFLLVTGVHVMLLLPAGSRRTIKPLLFVLFFVNALTIYFMDQFGIYVDGSMIRNVFQTDFAETLELASWRMVPYLVVYAFVPSLVLARARLTANNLSTAVRRKATLFACAVAAVLIGGGTSFKEYSSFFRSKPAARYLVTPANYVYSVARVGLTARTTSPRNRIPVGTDAVLGPRWAASNRPVLFVLVIGETARASSFSLNGYPRDTNPLLKRIPGLINFTDVSACGTSTADSLPCMFSPFARSDWGRRRGRHFESLLDVVERSGLPVTWLDNNSGCKGVCDGVEVISYGGASSTGVCDEGGCFDEVLLTGVESKIAAGRSALLVLHQKGSHGPAYHRRYPRAFERFAPACNADDFQNCTRQEIVNAYDNSILYTDHVLAELIKRLSGASPRFDTAMLYVSDHGESLGENGIYLHGLPYTIAPDSQTKVPMVLWMSDQFSERFGLSRAPIELVATSATFSHDHLFHSVLGALDVKSSVYQPDLDIFASGREPFTELAHEGVSAGN